MFDFKVTIWTEDDASFSHVNRSSYLELSAPTRITKKYSSLYLGELFAVRSGGSEHNFGVDEVVSHVNMSSYLELSALTRTSRRYPQI